MISLPGMTLDIITQIVQKRIDVLTEAIQNLKEDKNNEIKKQEQAKQEKIEERNVKNQKAISLSRVRRIELAEKAIEQSFASCNESRVDGIKVSIWFAVASFVSYYMFNQTTVSVCLFFLAGAIGKQNMRTPPHWEKWLSIYLRALKRLKNEEGLKVHTAVFEVLKNDLSIDQDKKDSLETKKILNNLPDEPVSGDPNEAAPVIPKELSFIVDHVSKQPTESFSNL